MAEELSDDELFSALGNVGAAINAARDPSVDPEIQKLAQSVADAEAAKLAEQKPKP